MRALYVAGRCVGNPELRLGRSHQLIGRPVRYSFHPKTDRYLDIFLAPLELGRFEGEAPFTIRFRLPTPTDDPSAWEWAHSGNGPEGAAKEECTYTKPGGYKVRARREDRVLRGSVVVRPARPPTPTSAALRDDTHIRVLFDEPVDIAEMEAGLESGTRLTESSLACDGWAVELTLAAELKKEGVLQLNGVRDRAQRPNSMVPATFSIAPLLWPSDRTGLVLAWPTGKDSIAVPDAVSGKARTFTLAITILTARLGWIYSDSD